MSLSSQPPPVRTTAAIDTRPLSTLVIRVAKTDDELRECFPLLQQLRPQMKSAQELIDHANLVKKLGEDWSFAYARADDKVVGIATYRTMNNLFWGRVLYVDDLVVDESLRGHGHGRALMDWLRHVGKALGCQHLQLDSGTQRHRAHHFYFVNGMHIFSYRFEAKL